MGGLYNTAESLGRFLGPAGFATMYAWSISSTGSASALDWVNYRFVFCVMSGLMVGCAALAWRALTEESLMKQKEGSDADVTIAAERDDDGDIDTSCTISSTRAVAADCGERGLRGEGQGENGVYRGASFVSSANDRREMDLV